MVAVVMILAVANVCLVLVLMYLIRELSDLRTRYLLQVKDNLGTAAPQPEPQHPFEKKPPVSERTLKLNAIEARRIMEGVNREYFSADRKKTNSEILKEQEHG